MPKYGQWGGPGGPGAVLNLPGISLSAVRIADGQSELSAAWRADDGSFEFGTKHGVKLAAYSP